MGLGLGLECRVSYVSKVSTRFRFFQPGFVISVVLAFVSVVLDAESSGMSFGGGYRSKYGTLAQNTDFFENLGKVISVRIRHVSCAGFGNACAELRMKFCNE